MEVAKEEVEEVDGVAGGCRDCGEEGRQFLSQLVVQSLIVALACLQVVLELMDERMMGGG